MHPDSDRGPVVRIEADIRRSSPRRLALTYELTGQVDAIRLPAPTAPIRSDGLWRRTCFEAFVGLSDRQGYLEFNLSPSSRWAAYGFTGQRAGMAPLEDTAAPKIDLIRTPGGLALTAVLELPNLPGLPADASWRLGLAAVIEDADGRIAYWALAHPRGKPDFHHPEGLACEIRASEDA